MSIKSDVIKKLDKTWDIDGQQKFIYHLIYSYWPLGKISIVKDWNDIPKNKSHRCSLSNLELYSLDNIKDNVELSNSIILEIEDLFYNNKVIKSDSFLSSFRIGKLAFFGKKTDTVLCTESIFALNDWLINKISKGDEDIIKSIKKMKGFLK